MNRTNLVDLTRCYEPLWTPYLEAFLRALPPALRGEVLRVDRVKPVKKLKGKKP